MDRVRDAFDSTCDENSSSLLSPLLGFLRAALIYGKSKSMLKALARLKIAFLFALLFGVQSVALSYHESSHAAQSAGQKSSQSISAVSDDCSLCVAQHTQIDSTTVQLEPSKTSFFPPSLIWIPADQLVTRISVYSQPRAPPQA
jgi:hypothetical protein